MPSHIRILSPKLTHLFVLLSYLFQAVAPCFATHGTRLEDDCFSLGVKTATYQKGNYAYPQITLTTRSGEESEATTITPFTPLHKMSGMRALLDEQKRSLGFTYRAKNLGHLLICWDGSLLLHNLKVAAPNLRIETDGSILLNGISSGNTQLQGRDIYFNGTNRFDALSLSFNDQGASRMAHVLPKSALITQELSLYSGLFLNDGQVSVGGKSLMHGSHLVNEGDFKTGTLQFDEKGTLKNKGSLKSTMITAPLLENLENYGPLLSDFDITCKRIINTGSIQGTGTMIADSFTNEGLMGDDALDVRVSKQGVNRGILKAKRIGGGGHFKNHHKLQVQELSVLEFTNQPDETLPVKATVEGESLHLTRHVRAFTNDRDATIDVSKLTMEKKERNPRVITNRGLIKGKDLTLLGTVSNTGEIEADDFTWEGDTFLNLDLDASKAHLKGDAFTNRGNLEIKSGFADVKKFVNTDTASLTLTPSSSLSDIHNEGTLHLQGGARIAELKNTKSGKVHLSQGASKATSLNQEHFEQESAYNIKQQEDNWIEFSVRSRTPHHRYKDHRFVQIIVNNESYCELISEHEIDRKGGRVRLKLTNFSLPKIHEGDSVKVCYQTPQIDFDIFTCNNDGQMDVLGVPLLLMTLINNTRSLSLKESSLLSLSVNNQGTLSLDGSGDHRFVALDNEGTLKFQVPVWLENASKWRNPGRIEGAFGVHMPTESLNPLEKSALSLLSKETLYLYGKNVTSTQDTEFNHKLSITAESFNNNHTIGAHEVKVDARTFNNNGTLKGRCVTVHATESGQNPGRLETSKRLDVDLPNIDWLGTMISNGDLFFKTANRPLTLNQSWLNVGRDLHMELLNGALHVKSHLQFPGNVKVKADSFTLDGDLKAAGDINIQTQGNIELKAKIYEIKPVITPQDTLRFCYNNPTAYYELLRDLSPLDEQQALMYFMQRVGSSDDCRRLHIRSLSDAPTWLHDSVINAIAHHFSIKYPPYYSDGTPEPSTYEHTLSKIASGGHLRLEGQNVNNWGGQIQGEQSLLVEAQQNITNGSSYKTERRETRIYNSRDMLWYYPVPEFKGNGSFMLSKGPLSLEAGRNIFNTHGLIVSFGDLATKSGLSTINKAGDIICAGNALLSGRRFENSREGIERVKTGVSNGGDDHGRWYINGVLFKDGCGRVNEPKQDYATSKKSILQSLGYLSLDFQESILNEASDITSGGVLTLTKARVINR
ncbi:MAG: hypothetical protein K2X53_01785, partial [Alphaproteobacteria bacterium]|nr:hypothetical protein [Alphaproteobacteria bacterium]